MTLLNNRGLVVVFCVMTSALAPPRVVVDLEVLANTVPLEGVTALRGLQKLLPEGPWQGLKALPTHRLRTFDLSRKFERVVCDLQVTRPAAMVAILRLLFEEANVERTRPLTAGEVVANFRDVLLPNCELGWRRDGYSFDDIDDAVAEVAFEGQLDWNRDVVSALRNAATTGNVGSDLTILMRPNSILARCDTAMLLDRLGGAPALTTPGPSRLLLPTLGAAVPLFSPFPTKAAALVPRVSSAPTPLQLAQDLLQASKKGRAYYLTTDPDFALFVTAAVNGLGGPNARKRIHTYHCDWSRRWGLKRPLPPEDNVAVLGPTLTDFRLILGLPP
mmetsp:Transcript_38847/g.124552  ORF Transcript_38847/g.124552 Transcript_38847/m.124552 type:complete len:332 (+) Transcript_38847:149-1144(+)